MGPSVGRKVHLGFFMAALACTFLRSLLLLLSEYKHSFRVAVLGKLKPSLVTSVQAYYLKSCMFASTKKGTSGSAVDLPHCCNSNCTDNIIALANAQN